MERFCSPLRADAAQWNAHDQIAGEVPGRPGEPGYEQVRDYVTGVLGVAESRPFKGGDVGLDLVEDIVAHRWNDYVGFIDRVNDRDNPLGNFLLERIKEHFPNGDCAVLDAAAGVGCDALFLIKKGFRVDINEADPRYAAVLKENADDQRIGLPRRGGLEPSRRLALYGKTWQDLRSGLPEGSKYDVALVLGNSICLVDPLDRTRCLLELTSVLWPDTGVLEIIR